MIYFIQVEDGPIKIGYAANPKKRLAGLETGSSKKLTLLKTMPGGPGLERALHKQFKSLRIRGEWFKPAPELIQFIEELTSVKPMSNWSRMIVRSPAELSHALATFRNEQTQVAVAARAKIRQATISRAESGLSTTAVGTIFTICDALGLAISIQRRSRI